MNSKASAKQDRGYYNTRIIDTIESNTVSICWQQRESGSIWWFWAEDLAFCKSLAQLFLRTHGL